MKITQIRWLILFAVVLAPVLFLAESHRKSNEQQADVNPPIEPAVPPPHVLEYNRQALSSQGTAPPTIDVEKLMARPFYDVFGASTSSFEISVDYAWAGVQQNEEFRQQVQDGLGISGPRDLLKRLDLLPFRKDPAIPIVTSRTNEEALRAVGFTQKDLSQVTVGQFVEALVNKLLVPPKVQLPQSAESP